MELLTAVEIIATHTVLVAGAAATLFRLGTSVMDFATSVVSFFKNLRKGDRKE